MSSSRLEEYGPAGAIDIFDTTLRDGSQQEGLSLTVDDKLRVAEQLDHLGVKFIEGGWPGANPKDDEFFSRAPNELNLQTSTLVAFGSTRHPGKKAEDDEVLRHLLDAGTESVCIVAKSSAIQVRKALRTTLEEGVAMAYDSVSFLVSKGLKVFFDAEHFFDGYLANAKFSMAVLKAAEEAGASTLVLCDTNGGMLPFQIGQIVGEVKAHSGIQVGIHCHNDTGCAVANSIAAVQSGATHVQGCVNGYGERTGNADLTAVIPDLSLKLNLPTIEPGRLERITPVSHHIAELVNMPPDSQQPYVGAAAFAHKAGLHTSAIARMRNAYEHIDPELVGNGTRFIVSEMAGRSTLALQAERLGISLDSGAISRAIQQLKDLEHQGYHFEVADGSLELLLRRAAGWQQSFYHVESYRVMSDHTDGGNTEATVKVVIAGERIIATAEGNGPVNALDSALRKAIGERYPELHCIHLVDYRVRVLNSANGTASSTRVLIDSTDGERVWTTMGVSENIIEASWQALDDSVVCGLLAASEKPAAAGKPCPD
ncbi:MAG: citramalate synthase [Actinobacteria bacterium]|nr:citramalate synthase [Actinomycetota bacterium]MCL5446347.1 citramalate synthase [Actinomycetota bacterium]